MLSSGHEEAISAGHPTPPAHGVDDDHCGSGSGLLPANHLGCDLGRILLTTARPDFVFLLTLTPASPAQLPQRKYDGLFFCCCCCVCVCVFLPHLYALCMLYSLTYFNIFIITIITTTLQAP